MQTTISHSFKPSLRRSIAKRSIGNRFITWAESQQEKRLEWLAFGVAGHGCIFTILTSLMVILTGNHFIFWPFVIGAMAMTLVVNLAAMPTRVTIPVLFFSLLIDLAIIAICLSNGFNTSMIYV